jgi:[ribosomal protein S18]-alanine N-acetyltransferase
VTSAEVTIVAMRPAHIDALMPHERAMFGTEAWTESAYRSELADTRLRHYVVAEGTNGDVLGWAGVMVIAETAQVLTIGVIPEARRRGTGRRMLAALTDEARRRDAHEMFLEVRVDNPAAQALYESDGYQRVGVRRGYYDAGRIDAVTMRRDL